MTWRLPLPLLSPSCRLWLLLRLVLIWEPMVSQLATASTEEANPVGFGILGTAFIARRLAWAINVSGHRLVATGSRDLAKAQAFAKEFGGGAVAGYEAVLDRPDVEVVYVPLPTFLRTQWVVKACQAGKHVLAEKPFARVTDLQKMFGACASTQFMDATFFMHSDRLQALRQGMGSIGELRRVSASMSAGLISRGLFGGNIRADPSLEPHGALGDIGWYAVRGILWAFDWELPGEVHCTSHDLVDGALTEVSGWAKFSGGRAANFDASFHTARRQLLELIGTNMTIRVDDLITPDHTAAPWELRWLAKSSNGRDSAIAAERRGSPSAAAAEVAMLQRMGGIARSRALEPRWLDYALLTTQVVEACAQAIASGAPVSVGRPSRDAGSLEL